MPWPSRRRACTTGSTTGSGHIFGTSAQSAWIVLPHPFDGPNEVAGMSWSADGSQVFTLGPGTVDVWDSRTLRHLAAFTVGDADQTPGARVLPDGHTL